MAEPALDARIRLQRGDFRLEMAMRLERPAVAALHGPSGCGKTTFLRCLAGLEPAAVGSVRVGGDCWQESRSGLRLPPHRRRVGLVFQDTRLFPHLNVKDNLLFGARQWRLRASRLDEIVDLLGLEKLLDRHPATLSGGERQRAAIARALLAAPRLLLLDEPLSAVDATHKAEILPYLERLFRQVNVPVVLVSHDWQDVLRLSHEVYVMAAGRLREHGPTLELQYRLGDHRLNALEAEVEGWDRTDELLRLRLGSDLVQVPARRRPDVQRLRLLVSPLEIAVSREPVTHSSILNVLACRLENLSPLAGGKVLLLLAGNGWRLEAIITRASARRLRLAPGIALYALIKSVVVDHADI